MEQAGLHTELENRLKVLATRIDEFSQMKGQAKGSKRLEDKNEIEKLERRFKALGDKLIKCIAGLPRRDRKMKGGSVSKMVFKMTLNQFNDFLGDRIGLRYIGPRYH